MKGSAKKPGPRSKISLELVFLVGGVEPVCLIEQPRLTGPLAKRERSIWILVSLLPRLAPLVPAPAEPLEDASPASGLSGGCAPLLPVGSRTRTRSVRPRAFAQAQVGRPPASCCPPRGQGQRGPGPGTRSCCMSASGGWLGRRAWG